MTDIGNTAFGVCLCIGITGSGTTAYPTAATDRMFLLTDEISGSDDFLQRIKQISGGNSFSSKDGKRKSTVQLSNCYIVKSTFNGTLQWFKTQHRAGKLPLYLILKDLSAGAPNWGNGNDTYQIGQDTSGNALNYLKCYVERVPWKIKGPSHWITSLGLIECQS